MIFFGGFVFIINNKKVKISVDSFIVVEYNDTILRAFSSAGQSSDLISRWSPVQVREGPPYYVASKWNGYYQVLKAIII